LKEKHLTPHNHLADVIRVQMTLTYVSGMDQKPMIVDLWLMVE